jgi:hypothetical protein
LRLQIPIRSARIQLGFTFAFVSQLGLQGVQGVRCRIHSSSLSLWFELGVHRAVFSSSSCLDRASNTMVSGPARCGIDATLTALQGGGVSVHVSARLGGSSSRLQSSLTSLQAQYPFPKEVWSPSGQYIAHVSKRPADRDSSVSLATDHHCIRSSAIETQTLMSALPLPRPNPPASLSFASTFSRTGGWWSRPKNWAGNTVFAIAGIALATYGVWSLSARKEVSDGDAALAGRGGRTRVDDVCSNDTLRHGSQSLRHGYVLSLL